MALIKCTECGKEVSDKAATCPNCGAPISAPAPGGMQQPKVEVKVTQEKKKGSCLKTILIVFGAIFVLAFIGSMAGGDDDVKDVTSERTDSEEPKNETENNENVSEEKAEEKKTVFSVGETAEYKDVQVSLLGYQESSGNDWGTPESGNIFVFPEIEITNNSDEEISISSMLSFECYVDDYKVDFSSNAFMAISTEEGKKQLDGSVTPGKKLKGVLGIEVPSDWSAIEIYYKDNAWLDSNFSFKIEK